VVEITESLGLGNTIEKKGKQKIADIKIIKENRMSEQVCIVVMGGRGDALCDF